MIDGPFYLPKEALWCGIATLVFVFAYISTASYVEACNLTIEVMAVIYGSINTAPDCGLINCGDLQ